MGRRKKEPRSVHRENIATAASCLFMKNGISATTMNDIAAEAGYSKATLYVYFKNKEEIIGFLVLSSMKKLCSCITNALQNENSTRKCYDTICNGLIKYEKEFPYYFRIVLEKIKIDFESTEYLPEEKETYEVGESIREMMINFLKSGIEKGDLKDNLEKGVTDTQEALSGASDIIAEMISDNAEIRKILREFIFNSAQIVTTLKPGEKYLVYETYENYKEPVNKIPSHRILAINRGEREECLKVDVEINEERCEELIKDEVLVKNGQFREFIEAAIKDSFERLVAPSLIRELRANLTDTANEQAIKMFEVNLKPLLMQPPLKDKVILGLDPAYRTGCKVAVIDESGNVIDKTVIYPTPPHNQIEKSEEVLTELITKNKVDAIAIGNGTASKESEIFVSNLIKKLSMKVQYMVVNEAGASVYSASKLGAEEFPDYDVSLRSAVSIARRLQDPLAELIKIDVKSIGVGQYQHDMPQKRLTTVLDGVVEDCVNSVGVDLNTASYKLLEHVSGLNASIAKNIVEYRKEHGKFTEREELLKVSKLGNKAYEQCAGFLRIPNEKNILDNTGVHPESYKATEKLLKMFNMTVSDVKDENVQNLPRLIVAKGEEEVAKSCGVGVPTLDDIVKELLKPGRDIRDDLPKPELRSDVLSIEDLKVGMVMRGTVRNVIDFGAFVDIGVHQDGLVHISEICDRYIKHPSEELSVGQIVKVKIISIDLQKQRIGLSIKRVGEDEEVSSLDNAE